MHPKLSVAPPARPISAQQKPSATSSAPPVYRPQQAIASAPPVFRPQAAPVQRKASAAPPVYRPYPLAAPVQAKAAHSTAAPPVYRPQPLPVRGIQRKSAATPGTGAPPVYKPSQAVTRALPPRPFLAVPPPAAPPAVAVRGAATLQAYFTHSGNKLSAEELAAIREQATGKKKLFDVIANDPDTPKAISKWLTEQGLTLKSGGKSVSVTQFLKALDTMSTSESDTSDTEEASSGEEDNGPPLLHRGDSLMRGLEEKQAYRHTYDDIKSRQKVFDDLPDNVQQHIHTLGATASDPFRSRVGQVVTDQYIISVAPLSGEKAKRSESTPRPRGNSSSTFRMVGTMKGRQFQEESGTSYANMSPAGYYNYSSETQQSHVLPSMVISPEHRQTGGNTTVTKTTFTNQNYDRGSEQAIFDQFGSKSGRLVAAVEFMDVEEKQ